MARALAPVACQVAEVQTNPFDALIAAGKLERREARMFEAQSWEPELRKSLDLGPSVPLRRVSEVYEVPEFPYHRVRVDRIYRTDRQAAIAAAGVSTPMNDGDETTPITERPSLPLPGELLWETAMVADHVMVQTEPSITRATLQRALPARTRIRDQITQSGLYLVEVPDEGERSLERAVLALGQLKDVVKFAEPDFLMTGADTTPNDPLYAGAPGPQWHLPKIMAPRAWDVIKEPKTPEDAESTVVAVVDTGVDYRHPDLAPNMWTNPNKIAGNGQDDDANGKIDDVSGWDFIGQSAVKTAIIQDNNPMDDSGHGTHVAGIIGAVGNNALGISGVCWGVKILPLRIIKKVGTGTYGTYSTALGALDYIKTLNPNGRVVAVANHSWGGSGYSLAMLNSINNPVAAPDPLPVGITSTFLKDVNQLTVGGSGSEQAKIKVGMTITGTGIPATTLVTIVEGSTVTLSKYTTAARTNQALSFKNPVRPKPHGVVHVAAAGNSRFNNDRLPTYPASIPSGFVISVGASDENDNVAIWSGTAGSNFGRLTVDLFAPGSNIWSTKLKLAADSGYGYESRNGTSMAAPQVAGSLALLRMWQPSLTDLQARQILIDQVDIVGQLDSKCLSAGRLNVALVMDKLYQPILSNSGGSTSGSGLATQPLYEGTASGGRLAPGINSKSVLYLDQGEVWGWGSNDRGDLGTGAFSPSSKPVKVPGFTDVIMLAKADNASFALKRDGTVWAWGVRRNGVLGDGTDSLSSVLVPEQVANLPPIVWLSAGGGHVLAVTTEGKVFAWGSNPNGQIGDGTYLDRLTPIEIPGLTNVLQADAGIHHSLAVCRDGSVFGWGSRSTVAGNRLGDGPSVEDAMIPTKIEALSDVVFADATYEASIFLKSDGTVWQTGRLAQASYTPVQVQFPTTIRSISGGFLHAAATDESGVLYAWGSNEFGAFGRPPWVTTAVPMVVPLDENQIIISCAAGHYTTFALNQEGVLLSAGLNTRSMLGSGRAPEKNIPIEHPYLTGVSVFGGSYATKWAVCTDGSFFLWGDIGMQSEPSQIPVRLQPSLFDGVAIDRLATEGRGLYFLARRLDGTV